MRRDFYMPTRIVWGEDVLVHIGSFLRDLPVKNILVVTDPIIAGQPFFTETIARLSDDGFRISVFDECGIDARVAHIDEQAARCRRESISAIVSIGGGSVMCTGKGIAIVATNSESFREVTGVGNFQKEALPMVMVPTTAGSGSEVSQFTIVKDDERHLKLLGGGPLSFPTVAILDPVVLLSLPQRAATFSAIDALSHAIEAYLTDLSTPFTDAIALEAARLQMASMRGSILDSDAKARGNNLLASAMANIACGNARLGHAHALSLPLEGHLDLPHPLGVGSLVPWTFKFNAEVVPEKGTTFAQGLGVDIKGLSAAEAVDAAVDTIFELYDALGFPRHLSNEQLPRDRIPDMAKLAVPGMYGSTVPVVIDRVID